MFLILALLLSFRHTQHVYSLPVLENNTANGTFSDPAFLFDSSAVHSSNRSTLGIVSSCYATTLACTWAAVHPNMSFYGHKKWQTRIGMRLLLVLSALLVPETIVGWAYGQMSSARKIQRKIESKAGDGATWTITHAHFLQMGGFKLQYTEDQSPRLNELMKNCRELLVFRHQLPGGAWAATLTTHDFITLLDENLITFPRITKETIEDKSKSDAFLKLLTVIQLMWFIVQIFGRVASHLEVTLIEITTVALVTNSLFMYCFWWSKPFNAEVPEELELAKHQPAQGADVTAEAGAWSSSGPDIAPCPSLHPNITAAKLEEKIPLKTEAVGGHRGIDDMPKRGDACLEPESSQMEWTSKAGLDDGVVRPGSNSESVTTDQALAETTAGNGDSIQRESGIDQTGRLDASGEGSDCNLAQPEVSTAVDEGTLGLPPLTNGALCRAFKLILADIRTSMPEPFTWCRFLWAWLPSFWMWIHSLPEMCIQFLYTGLGKAVAIARKLWPKPLWKRGITIVFMPVIIVVLITRAVFWLTFTPILIPVTTLAEALSFMPMLAISPDMSSLAEFLFTTTQRAAAYTILLPSAHQKDFLTMFYVEPDHDVYPASIFVGIIFGFIFGSIHFCALGSPFSTRGEYITWIIVTIYGILPFIEAVFPPVVRIEYPDRIGSLVGKRSINLKIIAKAYDTFIAILVLSRVCILGLTIAALRSLSSSALGTVAWIERLPHV